MVWGLYNVLFAVGYLLMLPRFLFRMWRRGGYRKGFLQRLGIYEAATAARLRGGRRVWIHAVSVGEVFVALRFLQEIRRRRPESLFVLSTTTSTGHALAETSLDTRDVLIYFPADFPGIIRRVLDLIQPAALVLVEGELWPNLLRLAHGRGIPIAVVNGRLSARSYAGYRKIRFFFRRAIECVDLVCMQNRTDAERMQALGVPAERLRVAGSAKYDAMEADPNAAAVARGILQAAGFGADDPVLLGGSTWAGEEAVLLDLYASLRADVPGLRLVLVPRHAERSNEVAGEIERRHLPFVRRSAVRHGTRVVGDGSPAVLLVDTTGELKTLYAGADVIFVGKSLAQHGGQNLIEPAVYGKPVLVGPNMENFRGIVEDFREAQAFVQVRDAAELGTAARRLLADPTARRALGERAGQLVAARRGTVRTTVEWLLPLLRG